MDKLLSVVIPTHNRAKYVGNAIMSVENQTYKQIEIIVVSDGSEDNTKDVVESYSLKYGNIKFYEHFPAKGSNFSRNFGASKATGDYIAFLDDDDIWDETKAEKQIALLKDDKDVGLTVSGFKFIYVNDNTTSTFIPSPPYDASKTILIDHCIGGTSSAIMRREIFEKVGGFDERILARQDYDLWIRCAQVTKIKAVKEPLVINYDYDDTEKISNSTYKSINACEIFEEKYKDLYNNLTVKENKQRKYNSYVSISKKALRNNEKRLSRKYSFIALKYKFSITPFVLFVLSFFKYSFVLKVKNKIFK